MRIKFYDYSKRINSTAIPTPAAGVAFDCTLKDSTSIQAPYVTVTSDTFPNFNYAYIEDFGRYYWIRDIQTVTKNVWGIALAVDALGSARSQILNSYQYVTRSSAEFNGALADGRYEGTAITTLSNATLNIFATLPQVYIMGCYGADPVANVSEGMTYYVLDSDKLSEVISHLLSTDVYGIDTAEISVGLQKLLQNPLGYITSLQAMRINLTAGADITTGYSTINVGGFPIKWINPDMTFGSINARSLIAHTKTMYSTTLTLAHHPQIARGVWLDKSDYSYSSITIPPFGTYKIERNRLTTNASGDMQIAIKIDVDLRTGEGILTITDKNLPSTLLIVSTAMLGVNIPLKQVTQDTMSAKVSDLQYQAAANDRDLEKRNAIISGAEAVVSQAAKGASGGVYGAIAGAVVGGIEAGIKITNAFSSAAYHDSADRAANVATVAKAVAPTVSSFGTMASRIYWAQNSYLNETFIHLTSDDNIHQGKPLCAVRQLSSVMGYVECANIDTSYFNMTENEQTSIINFLRNGAYLE